MHETLETLRSRLTEQEWLLMEPSLKAARECFERDGKCYEVLVVPEKAIVIGRGEMPQGAFHHLVEEMGKQTMAIHVCEVWFTTKNRLPPDGRFLRARDDPERKEAVGVRVILSGGKRIIMIAAEIRSPVGGDRFLAEWKVEADSDHKGVIIIRQPDET